MYDRFRQLGIPVTLTRNTDETLGRDERVNRILSAYGNNPNVIVLSNHINAGGGEGAEIVYALRNNSTLAENVLESIGRKGQSTRKYYQRRLPNDTSKDYYFIHRLTGNTQPLLIEYGFIDNKADLNKLQNNLLDYGEAVVEAVANYIGVPYIRPDGNLENTYIVKRGDSLYSIANQFGTTVDALKQANNLTNNILNIGQILKIPQSNSNTISPEGYTLYTVKRGDTLWKIATQFNINIDEIKEANNLTSNNLSINQQLLIPNKNIIIPPASNVTYTVKRGDSLWKIANEYGITVDELISANNLTNSNLQIGQLLVIPNQIVEDDVPEDIYQSNNLQYIVQNGDSLYSIAKKYGITAIELQQYNNLPSTLLSIGQVLEIPNNNESLIYYVQEGDNLYNISRKYNVPIDDIIRINSLNSNILSIGQKLIIPT